MTRRLIAGGAAAATAVGAGSLLLANGVSGGGGGARGVLVVLYLVFLVATLALLAGGLAWSEKWVDQIAATAGGPAAPEAAAHRGEAGGATGGCRHTGRRLLRRSNVTAPPHECHEPAPSDSGAAQGSLTPERRHATLRAWASRRSRNPPHGPGPYAAVHARRTALRLRDHTPVQRLRGPTRYTATDRASGVAESRYSQPGRSASSSPGLRSGRR